MNDLKYFFRGQFDGYVFKLFTPIHFLILGIMILGILLIVLNKEHLKMEEGKKVKKLIFAILLLEQISQYTWYFLAGTFTWGDGLPLYICRTAIISILIALATGNFKVKSISVYWGLFGGVLASIVKVIYSFNFPHFTNLTYFIGHLFM
ncbi:MAG: TIGR02206 family membrane protein, partial [Clostridiaceae bacterium]